jgi:DNA-binding response OmpR family regulator
MAETYKPDAMLLDMMMPEMDGMQVLQEVREKHDMPIIFLTARDALTDKVLALNLGADDYMTKPFSPRELVARVNAILRRTARAAEPPQPAEARVGPFTLDIEGRRLLCGTEEIHLTPTEFELLLTLATRPERAFSREELLDRVWGWRAGSATRTVDSHVAGLRRKLGADVVRTVQGHGYALGVDA